MCKKIEFLLFLSTFLLAAYSNASGPGQQSVSLTHGVDVSAGNVLTYIVATPRATYYLEKYGGGLSSIIDADGVDWLGFHNAKGSGAKGEYRGFPNAIHKQDGSYFHALNAGTELSSSVIEIESENHLRIVFTSGNGKWQGRWDFYPDRCDFTMTKVSPGYKYWVLYEGIPGGAMDATDFWYSSADNTSHLIDEKHAGDLPAPEWIAFGDVNRSRMIYLLHHDDDDYPDGYINRPDMTVFGFGRSGKSKFLVTPQTFSIGFIESTNYQEVESAIKQLLDK